jgi:hypothetical protein
LPETAESDAHLELTRAAFERATFQENRLTQVALSEISRLSLDLSLDGVPELRVTTHLAAHEPVAQLILDAPAAPPPEAFYRLPADSGLAVFAHAPEAEKEKAAKKIVLDAFFARGCDDPVSKEARAVFESLLFTGGGFVAATGFERARVEATSEALMKAPEDQQRLAAARDAGRQWLIVGIDDPTERWTHGIGWMATHQQPAGCRSMFDSEGTGTNGKPKSKESTTVRSHVGLGLPTGTMEMVTVVTPPERDATPHKWFLLVVPEKVPAGAPERTWIVVGFNESTLAARTRALLQTDSPATLASRPAVSALRSPATFGGLFDASWISFARGDDDKPQQLVARARDALRARDLTTGGRSAIVFQGIVHRTADAQGELVLRATADGAAIGDLITLFLHPDEP